jgi:hypothetical protein
VSPLAALTSIDMLGALLFIALAGMLEPVVEYHVERLVGTNRIAAWTFEHVFAPLLRALIIAGFVLLAYPALYGVRSAPTIAALLAEGTLRLTNLVNVLFLLSLLLPLLVPNFRRTAWLVPVQGLIATAMVFDWYTEYIGAVSIDWWPGAAPAAVVAVMVIVSHRLAADAGQTLGQRVDGLLGTRGFERLVPNATELVAQLPAVLYYGLSLGRQIAI